MSKQNDFIAICKTSQKTLKRAMTTWLSDRYTDLVVEDGYIYARGNCPVLVTAHMDTVHEKKVKDVVRGKGGIISSPQGIGGDDRCGVYMITEIVDNLGMLPYVLLCEDEEIGGVGSSKFCNSPYIRELEDMLFLVELDRANATDLVFYEDENMEFQDWCEEVTGYRTAYGTFSDISHLCPKCGVSGVNVSCGYYKAHTTDEYVVWEEMKKSIKVVLKLIREGVDNGKRFEYEESYYSRYWGKENTYSDYGFYTITLKNGEIGFAEGATQIEAIGWYLIEHPDRCFNDIEEVD